MSTKWAHPARGGTGQAAVEMSSFSLPSQKPVLSASASVAAALKLWWVLSQQLLLSDRHRLRSVQTLEVLAALVRPNVFSFATDAVPGATPVCHRLVFLYAGGV